MRGYFSAPSTPGNFRRLVGQFHISRQQQHFHYYSNNNGKSPGGVSSSLSYNSLRNYHLNHHHRNVLQQQRRSQHYYRHYSNNNNFSTGSRRSRLQLQLPPNLVTALIRRWNSSSGSSVISPLPVLHNKTTYPYDITIGSTTVTVHNPPKYPHLVPNYSYRSNDEGSGSSSSINNILTPTDLTHLEWMMKKEALLKQDMFLIGPPGGYKRRLVGLYAYLFGREVEVLQISRDSTEADIKQIREIRGKSVVYFDQASIRTALNGHILVLDGIEKAERNVLPLLNNLLENREMHLEDGRHLIPHTRYDTLVEEHGLDAVKRWKLERVHPDFRVIALGLPIPAFKGNPLDPPLRSRFQARNVGPGFHRDELLELLLRDSNKSVGDGVRRVVDLAYGINFMNSREFKERLAGGGKEGDLGVKRVGEDVPWFVIDSLFDGVRVFKSISESGLSSVFTKPASLLPQVFRLMYPFKSSKVDSLISQELGELQSSNYKSLKANAIIPRDLISKLVPPPLPSQLSTLCFLYDFLKPGGDSSQRAALLYGGQGCGKSTVAEHVGRLLLGGGGRSSSVGGSNPAITVIQVYKDMSTRDLFQVRGTNMEGDTIWRESPLVDAAVTGGVCVLDGVENLHESVVGVIGGLIREGEVLLPDGVTLLSRRGDGGDISNRPEVEGGSSSDRMSSRRTLPIHPDFRLIGVADSSDLEITPELCSVFMVFNVKMGEEEEAAVCGSGVEEASVLNVLRELRRKGLDEGDKSCLALSRGLSVAQVKRIGRRVERRRGSPLEASSSVMLYRDVMNAVCGQFLPMMERDVLRDVLKGCGIQGKSERDNKDIGSSSKVIHVDDQSKRFRIGRIEGEIAEEPEEFQAKIPKGGLFFDIDQHVGVLERLGDDFLNGQDHLLVIGNQGVGKNKIVDRLLEVLGRGREYIQLHRDTTVQSLTTNQKIEDGIIKVEDSPLVNAARHGLVLVIDEADKAPAHVTAVLKTLAERGEMILGDGRRIVKMDGEALSNSSGNNNLIPLHPNFRMIVLANRPGFPFLGNSFYGSMSHLFSVNPVDNPGVESEVQLLQGYGPGVEGDVLGRVAKAFSSLRQLSDDGVLAYPYSTREAVHVVKHLEVFKDDLGGALGNVFDFDWWGDDGNWNVVRRVMEENLGTGVLASHNRTSGNDGEIMLKIVEWGKKKSGGEGGESGRKDFSKYGDPKEGKFDATGAAHVGGNTWQGGSGGMSTAGLGGVGGPYRLTDGNPVFQVSQVTKQTVPLEILQKARELNRKLYEDKLRELRMSPHDSATYNSFLDPIEPQIHSIRNILNSLQAKSEERKWVKHQTSGDLDEGKLVEGLIGDKNVYRGRMDRRPEVGDPMLKPKLLRILVDCSGSMYRFNGYDARLDRVLSCVLMFMEGIGGGDYDKTIKYEIYGHSGDEYDWRVLGRDKDKIGAGGNDHSDKDEKSRLLVLKELFLHSQFCSSGDHTLEATATSIEQLSKVSDEFDQVFLVVLSDANFERYGISVEEFGKVLKRGDAVPGGSSKGVVKAYSIFIGSLGDQASRLQEGLGVGQSFVCLEVQELPKIIQRIFSEGVLSGGGSGSS